MDMNLLFPVPSPKAVPAVSRAETDEILERLFATPHIDVAQVPLHHRSKIDSGIVRLALAVLEDAVVCAIRHHNSRIREQKLAAVEALQWIEATTTDHPYAFENICDLFDLNPDWIRAQVRRRIAAGQNVDGNQLHAA